MRTLTPHRASEADRDEPDLRAVVRVLAVLHDTDPDDVEKHK